jgi:hypothetical protein
MKDFIKKRQSKQSEGQPKGPAFGSEEAEDQKNDPMSVLEQ